MSDSSTCHEPDNSEKKAIKTTLSGCFTAEIMQLSSSENTVGFKENTGAPLPIAPYISLSLSSCPSSSISSCSPSSLRAEALSASASTSPTRLLSHNPATSWCTAAFTPLGGRAAFDLGFSVDPSCQTKSLCCVKEKGHSMQMKKEAEFQRGKHVKPSS